MMDVDGDGKPDAYPKWVVNGLYALAYTSALILIAVTLGHGAYKLIILNDPTAWPRDIAIGVIVTILAAIGLNKKKEGSG